MPNYSAFVNPGPSEAREKYLRDQRDLARDAAVALEGMLAAAQTLHRPTRYCTWHGVTEHDCGAPSAFRCFECAQTYADKPCKTYRALEGTWTP